MANTLLLDRTTWDLCVDAQGNIALAGAPYAIIQDVASACRLFAGELWYETDKGIPYFEEAFGKYRPTQLLKALLIDAALAVPGVLSARCFLTNLDRREIGGQIHITTDADAGAFVVTL